MASVLPSVVVLALCVALAPCVSGKFDFFVTPIVISFLVSSVAVHVTVYFFFFNVSSV